MAVRLLTPGQVAYMLGVRDSNPSRLRAKLVRVAAAKGGELTWQRAGRGHWRIGEASVYELWPELSPPDDRLESLFARVAMLDRRLSTLENLVRGQDWCPGKKRPRR